jgi:hypothetical protein
MGRNSIENCPMGQDEWKFLKYIPSHRTKNFLKASHPMGEKFLKSISFLGTNIFLQNFDFITNSISVFVIDGSLANSNDTSEI